MIEINKILEVHCSKDGYRYMVEGTINGEKKIGTSRWIKRYSSLREKFMWEHPYFTNHIPYLYELRFEKTNNGYKKACGNFVLVSAVGEI